jgi:hypothetical protein
MPSTTLVRVIPGYIRLSAAEVGRVLNPALETSLSAAMIVSLDRPNELEPKEFPGNLYVEGNLRRTAKVWLTVNGERVREAEFAANERPAFALLAALREVAPERYEGARHLLPKTLAFDEITKVRLEEALRGQLSRPTAMIAPLLRAA